MKNVNRIIKLIGLFASLIAATALFVSAEEKTPHTMTPKMTAGTEAGALMANKILYLANTLFYFSFMSPSPSMNLPLYSETCACSKPKYSPSNLPEKLTSITANDVWKWCILSHFLETKSHTPVCCKLIYSLLNTVGRSYG